MVRDVAVVSAAVGLVAVSYGAIAVGSGFPLWVPALLSLTVLAGSAEFLFVGICRSGWPSPTWSARAGAGCSAVT